MPSLNNQLKQEVELYQTAIDDLQAIFDNSYDVLYVADGKGKTLRVSSACQVLWGEEPEDLIGKSVYELEEKGIFQPSATRIALEQGKKVHIIQRTKEGRTLMVVSTPIRDSEDNITRVVNASRDMTESHKLEEELNEMKMLIDGYRNQLSRPGTNSQDKLIYRSRSMNDIISILPRLGTVDSTVLITGDSGVGKEVVANYIHENSPGDDNPFIKINCASIPEALLESELFGYEQGAFTGAGKKGKAGLFELANEGTLFLDEIGDMPLQLQGKLLRVLQEGEFMRIGGQKPIHVKVRIIAATNQNLEEKIKENLFRRDLFYRLNVIPIDIPPLRDRKEDIFPLIQHFLEGFSSKFNMKKVLSQDVINLLEEYSWPGNVRELKNIVERIVVISNSQEINLETIPSYIKDSFVKQKKSPLIFHEDRGSNGSESIIPLKEAVMQTESHFIQRAARQCSNLTQMAQLLGVNQSTVSRKMQKYGLLDKE
ncbi:sigma-54 interaction domain-containing protein [Lentibacillus juripiscarius]